MSFSVTHKKLFLALSDAQRESLRRISADGNPTTFQIGESLRKLGLVNRNTEYTVKRVFADHEGEHIQYETKTPIKHHEWNTTLLGEQVDELRQKFLQL